MTPAPRLQTRSGRRAKRPDRPLCARSLRGRDECMRWTDERFSVHYHRSAGHRARPGTTRTPAPPHLPVRDQWTMSLSIARCRPKSAPALDSSREPMSEIDSACRRAADRRLAADLDLARDRLAAERVRDLVLVFPLKSNLRSTAVPLLWLLGWAATPTSPNAFASSWAALSRRRFVAVVPDDVDAVHRRDVRGLHLALREQRAPVEQVGALWRPEPRLERGGDPVRARACR